MENSYLKTSDEIAKDLNSDLQKGLSSEEAKKKLTQYGPNLLKEEKGKSALLILFSQFTSLLILILIAASAVSLFLSEVVDAVMIIAIVIINAIVGFIQEYRVERTIRQLKKLVTSSAFIYRNGKLTQIPSADLVPGDLIVLEEGQKVPADIRISWASNLKTDEASLTGESTPVSKNAAALAGTVQVADQTNMLFSGTSVTSGKAIGIVVRIGMSTEIGKIANLVSKEKQEKTPLQIKLDNLGKFISKAVLLIAAIIGIQQIIFGQQIIQALISAIALSVAAIPEGLPAVVTISLALGTKRLLKQKSLIRNLAAGETLGSVDYICADKTGTLTEGIMQVTKVYTNGESTDLAQQDATLQVKLHKILSYGLLSSNARLNGEKIIGDPTEAALVKAAINQKINQDELLDKYPRLDEIPFSSERKMMSVVVQGNSGKILISKGATETILEKCSKIEVNGKVQALNDDNRKQILKTNSQMADDALRILAFAYKETEDELENGLIFLGLQGMIDPPKSGVREAIEVCQKQAGIKVVMITGDHLKTASAIARDVGIEGECITGEELDKLSDEEFVLKVEQISIYARVNPEHKIRIIKALKANGHQVAMTGDGVNDAAALKASDIGVAMGITGTDVAKEASDMILLDDNFTTIVSAVKEGRAIFDNIRKFVNYLLSSNIMEVLVIFSATFFGSHLPLLPIHLLWINLITDGLPALALGVDPPRKNIMDLKPAEFRQNITGGRFVKTLILVSVLLTISILAIFFLYEKDPIYEQTMVFTSIVVYEMLRIMAIRKEYNMPLFSNKYLLFAIGISILLQITILYLPLSLFGLPIQQLFKVVPLHINDWALIIGIGVFLFAGMNLLTQKLKSVKS